MAFWFPGSLGCIDDTVYHFIGAKRELGTDWVLGWSFASSPSAFMQAGDGLVYFGCWVEGWFDLVLHEFYDDLLILDTHSRMVGVKEDDAADG